MTKSITRNYLYNVIYQVLALITPLITTSYISRVLGVAGVGIYSYTFSIVTYFVILGSLGIANYAQREIAYNRENKKKQSKIFLEMLCLRLITTIISLLMYYLFIFSQFTDKTIYWLQALNIISLLFDISWFFQGLEEFGKIVLRNIIVRVLNVVFIFIFIKTADDLNLYVFLMGIMNIVGGLSMFPYLRKYLCKFEFKGFSPFHNFYIILQLFLPQIAIQVYTVLDKTMIGMWTGSPLENGYYEQAEKIAKMPLAIITALGTVMLPRIAYAYASKKYDDVKTYMIRSYHFVWFLGVPIMFGIMGVAPNALPWFLGPGFDKSIILLQLFSVLVLVIGLSNVTGIQYMVPTNQQNKLSLTLIIGAIFNFLLNWCMIPRYMSVGATISSILTEILITIVQFIIIRKVFSIGDILKLSKAYFMAGGIMFVAIYGLGRLLYPSVLHTVILISIGIYIYIIILYITKDMFFMDIYYRVQQKIRTLL